MDNQKYLSFVANLKQAYLKRRFSFLIDDISFLNRTSCSQVSHGQLDGIWRLLKNYESTNRAYHNFGHIERCLEELDMALESEPVVSRLAVEFALYLHDAGKDEASSAKLAKRILKSLGVPSDFIESVVTIILATDHQSEVVGDARLAQNIDLAILGQPWYQYQRYENAIRAEYTWVEPNVFKQKRSEVLARFLAKSKIFSLASFERRYERQARQNLAKALKRLTQ